MSKVLLVEDDNNLREIYEARLQAEGYTIVSAKDGEEALVLAKQEHPDLIISDVMMPNISGFEMLDILRNTQGLKETKVIMLTALGQAEDRTRADSLGADRYLVKSQVTLEDIVKAAQDLLNPSPDGVAATPAPTPAVSVSPAPAAASPTVTPAAPPPPTTPAPPSPAPAVPPSKPPTVTPTPAVVPVAPTPPVTPPATSVTPSVPPTPPLGASAPSVPPTPSTVTPPPAAGQGPSPASNQAVVPSTSAGPPPQTSTTATPSSDTPPAAKPKIPENLTQSTSSEEATVKAQIDNFVKEPVTSASPPVPHGELSKEPENPPPAPPPDAPAPEPPTPPQPPTATPPPTVAGPTASEPTAATSAPAQASPSSSASPVASSDQLVANAVNDLVSSTVPSSHSKPPAPQPAPSADTQAVPPPVPIETTSSDGVTVAHKKIIQPIAVPAADSKPGLDELLAREGINDINSLPHPPATPLNTAQTPSYQTPHPPGHVISPNTKTGVDPSSIAL